MVVPSKDCAIPVIGADSAARSVKGWLDIDVWVPKLSRLVSGRRSHPAAVPPVTLERLCLELTYDEVPHSDAFGDRRSRAVFLRLQETGKREHRHRRGR